MYGRTITLTLKDSSVGAENLKNFANTIINNPMYEIIIARIKESEGFMFKTHSMIETNQGIKIVTQIIFEDKERFDLYANLESNQSVWDMLLGFAGDAGINLHSTDEELTIEKFFNDHISSL